jgi:phosphatidylglycerol---prolipoprotein diacylglyceryl transferase
LSYALLSLPSPPSPVIFEVGPFALHYHGLLIALGIAVGTWLTGRELARKGYDPSLALDSLFFVIPLGFIGARVWRESIRWRSIQNFAGVAWRRN